MKKYAFTVVKIGISILILGLLVHQIGWEKLGDTLIKVNLAYYPFILLIYLVSFLLGAWNLQILLQAIERKVKFYRVFKYSLLSWALGLVTPGKIGEFSIAYLLKKEGVRTGEGMAIAIADRIITVFVLFIFAIIGFIMFLENSQTIKLIGVFAVSIILGAVALSRRGRKFIREYILRKYATYFARFYVTLQTLASKKKSALLANTGVTVVKWVITAIEVLLIFMSLGSSGNFWYIVLISMTLIIINLVPVTYHGIGIKEAVGVYLYGFIGIPSEVVVITYTIFNILAYGIAAVIFLGYSDEFREVRLALK